MQKFANDPSNMVNESIRGFVKCYPDIVTYTESERVLKSTAAQGKGRVGIATGGGFGHDPAFIGYIGQNMVDTVAAGDIFMTPSIEDYCIAFRHADAGEGVACLYGNYERDIASVEKAIEIVKQEGIVVKCVVAKDDVALSDPDKRRGSAGEILMWKVGGAAASMGYDLDNVIRVVQKAVDNTKSISVGLASCIIPMVGRPNYLIEVGTMEIGVGHHGTSSLDTCKLRTADETVDIMLDSILADMPLGEGEQVAVLVSGLGNTMLMELHILFSRIYDVLKEKNIKIHRSYVGNYFTALDMMGASISVMKLDDELKQMMDVPVYTAAFNHFHIKK